MFVTYVARVLQETVHYEGSVNVISSAFKCMGLPLVIAALRNSGPKSPHMEGMMV